MKLHGMMKNIKKIVIYGLVLTILIIGGIAIWFSTLERWEPPVRPGKVPQDAIWAGGPDGGCFFLLQSQFSDTSRFAIYFDYGGDLWYDGYFYCDKKDFEQIAELDWRELITWYNGVYVFMKDPRDKNKDIAWRKVMPANIPDPDEVYWVEGDNGGWFFEIQSAYEDTCHFIIYHGITGEVLRDGLFYCDPYDFERISNEIDWNELLKSYEGNKVVMTDPNDKSRHILWYPIE